MKRVFLVVAFALFATFSFAQSKTNTKTSVQLIRNATLVIHYAGQKILVDPMLSAKGALQSFAGIERNPTVDLKMPTDEIVNALDLVLVTHSHPDHFDEAASKILNKSIKLINQPADADFFKKENFTNAVSLDNTTAWNNISIHRIEAQHGTGEVLKMMGKTSGYVLTAKNQPTVYIVGDGIWTEEIKKNIQKFAPDYIIVNSGGAVIPKFEKTPILMDEEQTMALIRESGKAKIIAVHMNALDHCRTTRESLRKKAEELKISKDKLLIPEDGETIEL
ncbi:MBL fold metallo-hydrolase [Adhaeribacter radiodurans]|uniref:MBL fold metallo-hydrolase n=1 Tax=Adhaeribacter radiodurans TaxID=2745197 RepID=A0A7L7L277_9BACT|nr:MBL fold metallo-hydrolase [Adhaeribacter radiodurans]QMU26685.1 MBL fold metallo-hydrolase [Adhaeribacter radiodurans]